jgi:hypothetical protein
LIVGETQVVFLKMIIDLILLTLVLIFGLLEYVIHNFSVSTNGFIDFSNSTADGNGTGAFGYANTAFSSNTIPAITPFYDDLTAQGGTGALGNSIKYLVSGDCPK